MRALKQIARYIVNALLLFIVLPVTIVGLLGLILSPFQTTARATEPDDMMEVNDLMLSEVVNEQVRLAKQNALHEESLSGAKVEQGEGASAQPSSPQDENSRIQQSGEPTPEQANSAVGQAEVGTLEGEAVAAADTEEAAPEWGANAAASETEAAPTEAAFEESPAVPAERASAPEAWAGELDAVEAGASTEGAYSSDQLREQGVISDGGVNYTWYSQRVLPGEGLSIEGRHVSEEGYVVDAQERIVVASSDLPYGTEIAVPFGDGVAVVLDTGCPAGVVDVYTAF